MIALALMLAPFAAQEVAAQATGLPTFSTPSRWFGASETGVTLSQPRAGGSALEGRYGHGLTRSDLSFRVGYSDPGEGADGGVVLGAEARVPVMQRSRSVPLDGALVVGIGWSFAGGDQVTYVPLGLSLGRRFVLDGPDLQLAAYGQPTVVFGRDSAFVLGLGVDVRIRGVPDIRVNWGAGDLEGFSISLFWSR